MRVIALSVLLIAGLGLPAAAQTAEDAAQWLKSLGVELDGKEATAALVLEAVSLDLVRARGTLQAADDLMKLKAFPKLVDLRLGERYGSDEGLAVLVKAVPKLARLHLAGTDVGDAGMTSLTQIKSLVLVDVTDTDVSEAGEKILRDAIPNIRVRHDHSPPRPRWTRDPETGCRIWKRQPWRSVTYHWSGPCVDGIAQGEGILEWRKAEPGKPPAVELRYEGRLRNGRRDGPGLQAGFVTEQGEWRDDLLYAGRRFVARLIGEDASTEEFVLGGKIYRAILTQRDRFGAPGGRYDGGWVNSDFQRSVDPEFKSGGFLEGPHGLGAFTASDGTVLEGVWDRGCLRVAGQYTRSLLVGPDECGEPTLMAALGKAPAAIQSDAENWRDCAAGHPDFRVVACSALIASGRESGARLAIAHNNRGHAYAFDRAGLAFAARTDYFAALKDYDEAIRLNPSHAEAFANRGWLYINGGIASFQEKFDRAIQDLDVAIRLDPAHAKAFRDRALAYYIKGQHDRAIEDYDAAIRLDPSHADTFHARARVHQDKGQPERAITDLEQVTRLEPTNARAWLKRCETRARIGQLDAALSDCDQVLRLPNADTRNALEARGMVHFKAGRFAAAIADYDAALKLWDSPYTRYSRGLARQRNGDTQGGTADIAAAIAKEPTVAETMAKDGVR